MANPSANMFFHKAIQYRPTYTQDAHGGTVETVSLLTQAGDASDGSFKCHLQMQGKVAESQAGGDVQEDQWVFYCLPRDVRIGDMFKMVTNIEIPFYIRVHNYTPHPNTGTITSFTKVFCLATVPPEGYHV